MKAHPPAWLTDEDQQFYQQVKTELNSSSLMLRFIEHPLGERHYKALATLHHRINSALSDGTFKNSRLCKGPSQSYNSAIHTVNVIAYEIKRHATSVKANNQKISNVIAKLRSNIHQLENLLDERGVKTTALELLPEFHVMWLLIQNEQQIFEMTADAEIAFQNGLGEPSSPRFCEAAEDYERQSAFDAILKLLQTYDNRENNALQHYKVNGRAPSKRTVAIRATTFALLDRFTLGRRDLLPQILEGVPYISLIGFIAGLHAHKKPMEYAEAKDEILKAVNIWKNKETRLVFPPVPNF